MRRIIYPGRRGVGHQSAYLPDVAEVMMRLVALIRELREMRYLWQQPGRMDNSRLVSLIGPEPHTPLDIAVTATLRGLGCLPAARDQTSQPG